MANIKSQKKRNLTNEAARQRNKAVRSEIKTAEKKVQTAIDAGDQDAAAEAMRHASRLFDKAVSKGVYTKNRAANHKSSMAKAVDRMGAA